MKWCFFTVYFNEDSVQSIRSLLFIRMAKYTEVMSHPTIKSRNLYTNSLRPKNKVTRIMRVESAPWTLHSVQFREHFILHLILDTGKHTLNNAQYFQPPKTWKTIQQINFHKNDTINMTVVPYTGKSMSLPWDEPNWKTLREYLFEFIHPEVLWKMVIQRQN